MRYPANVDYADCHHSLPHVLTGKIGVMGKNSSSRPQDGASGYRPAGTEKPTGKWNLTEVITRGDQGEFKVNGKVVMRYTAARIESDGVSSPLSAGRIQLQSEGAEIFFSDIRLRELS